MEEKSTFPSISKKIRVLIVNSDPYDPTINPYIHSIMDDTKYHFSNIEFGWGSEKFWNEDVFSFDIVHFHFSHLVLDGGYRIEDVEKRFAEIKEKAPKLKFVATCHNFSPHIAKKSDDIEVYNLIYKKASQIYHLASFSQKQFCEKYPDAENLLLPHPVYNKIFTNFYSQTEAKKYLSIPAEKKYILCMGAFRTAIERKFVISIARKLKKDNFVILAPSFYNFSRRRNLIKMYFKMLKYFFYSLYSKICFPNIYFTGKHCGNFINDELVEFYFAAADIVLLQRLRLLNSGNLPLAYYFGKVVTGTKSGNSGQILQETGNPTFNPNDLTEVVAQIKKAYELSKTDLGENNRKNVLENCLCSKIGKLQGEYYISLMQKN